MPFNHSRPNRPNPRERFAGRGGNNRGRNRMDRDMIPINNQSPNKPSTELIGAQSSQDLDETKKLEKKPNAQRTRLFVGNLASGTTDEEFRKLFSKYGELNEVFVHSDKGFAFVRLDSRTNAENAKYDLDGKNVNGRQLRVRFASSGAVLSVKNLSSAVSNELLHQAFAKFGQVVRAVVIVDDKGRSTNKGIVEFNRKITAQKTIQQINDGCFLMTTSPRVISVSLLDQEDAEDGLTEKNIMKTPFYYSEREMQPRFTVPGTFEHEFAKRWKALDDLEREQRDSLEKSLQAAREKLESEMENSMQEHRTMLMKQDLIRRQEELERLEEQRKREVERRQQLEIARMDAHNKEMVERQHRQEILRAQIDGTYKNEFGNRGGPPGRGCGRPQSPICSIDPRHEFVGNGVMGEGGLAPAPSRFAQRHELINLVNGVNNHQMGQAPPMGRSFNGPHFNHRNQNHQQANHRRNLPEMDYHEPHKRRRQ